MLGRRHLGARHAAYTLACCLACCNEGNEGEWNTRREQTGRDGQTDEIQGVVVVLKNTGLFFVLVL